MELFIKFYTDKPHRLGIKFTYEFQAVKAYEDLVRLFGENELQAVFELSRGRLNLALTSVFNGKQFVYQSLEFKEKELQTLRGITDKHSFEFVHIFAQHNTLLVAKPFRKAEFFSIRSLELRGVEFISEDY